MSDNVKLDQLLAEFLKYAPDAIVDQQADGNIVLVTNLRLAEDKSTLVPFGDEEEEDS